MGVHISEFLRVGDHPTLAAFQPAVALAQLLVVPVSHTVLSRTLLAFEQVAATLALRSEFFTAPD